MADTTSSPTTAAPAAENRQYIPRDEKGEIDPDAVVDVTHGYGRVPRTYRNRIDRTLFIGGVARNVQYRWIQEVRRRAPGTVLYTFAPGATDSDFVRVCGLAPELLDPDQQATLLASLDPYAVVLLLGREHVIALCEKLLAAVDAAAPGRGGPGAGQQQTGRAPSDLAARHALGIGRPQP